MAGNKYISNNAGTLTEIASSNTSAGVADANKIVSLNGSGVLDATVVNSKTTSAGAGDSGKVVALNGSGRIDTSMMPVGVSAEVKIVTASEALAAGDFVNIWESTGAKARKADATTAGKRAHGFVLAAVSGGASATVYLEGINTAVTGQTPGDVFLSTTAGLASAAAPSGSGNVVQRVGAAVSATEIAFERGEPVVLA
jgi:hypothetical protein